MKGEASGFPHSCTDLASKQKFVMDFYYENRKVLLRLEKIEKNSAIRSVAKLMLNALFGKLIQQERNFQTVIIKDPDELTFYLNPSLHQVTDIYCSSNTYTVLTYKDNLDDEGNKINNVLNSHVPAHICLTSGMQTTTTARLMLYKELEKLNSRCFYMDTDSLLYLERGIDNEYTPNLSSAIGGLTNELEQYRKSGSDFEPYINEFVCIGPKTYAYRVINEPENSPTFKPIYVVKCKGLRLTNENAHIVNMEMMK